MLSPARNLEARFPSDTPQPQILSGIEFAFLPMKCKPGVFMA
jgi:hypothetical protein